MVQRRKKENGKKRSERDERREVSSFLFAFGERERESARKEREKIDRLWVKQKREEKKKRKRRKERRIAPSF